jgi:hypothetical protein
LVAQLGSCARFDRVQAARLIVYLGEVDARGLFREHAYPSLFAYAVGELRMSEAEAYLRIHAARVARAYPAVISLLASGEVNLSALKLIGPVLTSANHSQLLERVRDKRKRDVELIVSELAPRSDVPDRVRKLPGRRTALSLPLPAAAVTCEPAGTAEGDDSALTAQGDHAVRAANGEPAAPEMDSHRDFVLEAPRVQRGSCVALRPGRYKVELTASQALHDKLEQLQHLLRHQVPGGELATIVERAVDLLLSQTLKRRLAQKRSQPIQAGTSIELAEPATSENRVEVARVERAGASKAVAGSSDSAPCSTRQLAYPRDPATATGQPNASMLRKTWSRYVRRAVVREVYARDEGQCTFVSANGRRCSERGALELHHVIPFGLGGPATVENLRVLCRAHNALFAERDFGADHIQLKRSQGRSPHTADGHAHTQL